MPRDHSAGLSHTSRRSWCIPGSRALLLFLGNVACSVVAALLEPLLKHYGLWGVVWGVFWAAMAVTVIMAEILSGKYYHNVEVGTFLNEVALKCSNVGTTPT